jgi:hypothetical protein
MGVKETLRFSPQRVSKSPLRLVCPPLLLSLLRHFSIPLRNLRNRNHCQGGGGGEPPMTSSPCPHIHRKNNSTDK